MIPVDQLVQELVYLRADLELLRQEVDSMNLDIKLLRGLLDITDMTQRDTFGTEQ